MRTGVGASLDSRIIGKPWALMGYVIGGNTRDKWLKPSILGEHDRNQE